MIEHRQITRDGRQAWLVDAAVRRGPGRPGQQLWAGAFLDASPLRLAEATLRNLLRTPWPDPTPLAGLGRLRSVLQEALDVSPPAGAGLGSAGPSSERVDRVRRYLEAHLSDPLDLAALSRTFSISPYHLSRVFRDRVGVPPHRYLTNLRVARAKELLATSTMSVTQVAARVGFGSLSHFTATFRRVVGLTPTAYKRSGRSRS